MSKICMVEREKKRQKLITKYAEKRKALTAIVKNVHSTIEEREAAQWALQKLPRNSSRTRGHNRCRLTGRPRGVYKKVGLARNKFRELAMSGAIPGLVKASW